MKLLRALIGDRWTVVRTIWPYKDGYGVYNRRKRTIVETGIPKSQAQDICDEMNRGAR